MSTGSKMGLAIAAIAIALTAGVSDADAHRIKRKKKAVSSSPVCVATVEGSASSTGILGLGTAKARDAALDQWITRTAAAYGDRYANFSKARVVRWDCKKNALILAKCIVTAKPCRK